MLTVAIKKERRPTLQLALIPLDKRPVNTRYPALLADSFGITLHLPPPALLSRFRQPADCVGLIHWLDQLAPTIDGLLVSLDLLGDGSLTVNLQVLQWLADGVFDLVVLNSDDTNPVGLPTREKRWLTDWGTYLGLGERRLMYLGADEVGCTLLARMANQLTDTVPTFTTGLTQDETSRRWVR